MTILGYTRIWEKIYITYIYICIYICYIYMKNVYIYLYTYKFMCMGISNFVFGLLNEPKLFP